MRDHYGEVCFFPDADGLANRAEQTDGVGAFVAHVGVVDTAVLCGDASQFDDLFCTGEAAGCVIEAGRDTDRAFLHGCIDQGFHAIQLFRPRLRIRHPHHFLANGSLTDK